MKQLSIPDPQRFRNQVTGTGATLKASERSGARRSQCAIDCAPPEQRKFATGYPAPTPDEYCLPPGAVTVKAHIRGARR